MKFLKLTPAFVLILFLSHHSLAQSDVLNHALKKLIVVNDKLYLSPEFKGKSYMFSIGIGVSDNGIADTVFRSENEIFDTKLINFEKVATQMKKDKKLFNDYKGKFLVLTINLERWDEKQNKTVKQFDPRWGALVKDAKKIQPDRQLVTLTPLLIVI